MLGQLIYLAKHSLLLSAPSFDIHDFLFTQLFSKLIEYLSQSFFVRLKTKQKLGESKNNHDLYLSY